MRFLRAGKSCADSADQQPAQIPGVCGEHARALLLVLSSLLRDALLAKEGVAPRLSAYATMIDAIGRERKHLSASLQKALEARSELDLNMAPALVLSCLARAVYED